MYLPSLAPGRVWQLLSYCLSTPNTSFYTLLSDAGILQTTSSPLPTAPPLALPVERDCKFEEMKRDFLLSVSVWLPGLERHANSASSSWQRQFMSVVEAESRLQIFQHSHISLILPSEIPASPTGARSSEVRVPAPRILLRVQRQEYQLASVPSSEIWVLASFLTLR